MEYAQKKKKKLKHVNDNRENKKYIREKDKKHICPHNKRVCYGESVHNF